MNNIFLLADLHGKYEPFKSFITKCEMYDIPINTIILLGDTGANFFFNKRDEDFKTKLNEEKINLFLIRGNHEERPSICMQKDLKNWHIERMFNNWVYVENKYPYIKYALDEPSVYNIDGKSTLIIPGAYSVDKEYRLKNNYPYFSNEQLTKAEMQHGLELIKKYNYQFDYILAHTCPISFEPYINDLFLCNIDHNTIDKTTEKYLDKIIKNVKYQHFYFGHYHSNRNIKEYNATMVYSNNGIYLGDLYS